MNRVWCASFLIVCLLTAFPVLAQIGTSTITGRVTDSTDAVVPGAAVTVVHTGTNFTFNATTNNDGLYRVLSLNPGMYRITAEAQGFKKTVRDEVELRTGDTLAVDFALQVGNVSESVEVSGVASLLETETSATGTLVSGTVLYDMPLYQRYVNSTMNLVPGMTSGGYAYGGDLGSYHLAGQRSGAIGIFEDGVNGNDQQGGTGTVKPLQNSVAEVKVLTTVPPAEYGHSAGGVISVVKKSGSNEFHGMASWYGRTRMMQHRLFYRQSPHLGSDTHTTERRACFLHAAGRQCLRTDRQEQDVLLHRLPAIARKEGCPGGRNNSHGLDESRGLQLPWRNLQRHFRSRHNAPRCQWKLGSRSLSRECDTCESLRSGRPEPACFKSVGLAESRGNV